MAQAKKDEKEKEKEEKSVAQKTTLTKAPVGYNPNEQGAYNARVAADEAAARGQAAIDKEKAGGVAKQTGRAQATADDDDPEPQAKSYKTLPEYAAARRAWLAKRKAKADAQKEAMK